MDWGNAAQIGSFLIAALALAVSVWNMSRGRLSKIELKVERTEDRIGRLEGELKHLPDRTMTHRLELAISDLKGQVAQVDERLKPVAAMSERMQEFLIERAK